MFAALWVLGSVAAQEEAARPPAPAAADFGDGLGRLAALGLPDMKGATWVKAPEVEDELVQDAHEFRSLNAKLRGGAWKLAGEPPRLLGFGTATWIDTGDEAAEDPQAATEKAEGKPGLLERMLKNHAASKPPPENKPAPGPSLEDDVKQLADAFGNETVVQRLIERLEYDSDVLAVPAHSLIFAAQVHAAGHPEAANRLAAAIFAAFPDTVQVIDAAVGHFASAEHTKVTDAFFETRDWKAYRDGLKALLEKYPRGWTDTPGVALLLPAVEKRVDGVMPPTPALPGIELKPEALAALAKLLEASTAPEGLNAGNLMGNVNLSEIPAEHRAELMAMLRRQGGGMTMGNRDGLWILPAPNGEKEEGAPSGPVAELQAMGMDGLIALAAVAEDSTLVPVSNDAHYSGPSFGSDDAPSAADIYDSLNRPRSRGEIARDVLVTTLPRAEDDVTPGAADLRDAAVDFWKKHRDKSALELAVLFIHEGDEGQRMQAAQFLAQGPNKDFMATFEKVVLAANEPSVFANEVESYLDRRKAEARGFFDAFSKALTKELDGVDLQRDRHNNGTYHILEAGSLEKYLKRLSVKVGAVSLAELIEEALKEPAGENEERRPNSAVNSLASAMAGVSIPDCLKAVAAYAPKAAAEQWLNLHQVLLNRIYRDQRRGTGVMPPVVLSADVLELWRPLLAKNDPLPDKHVFTPWVKGYGGATLGDATALMLETAAFPSSGQLYTPFARICDAPETTSSFVKRRVSAWIEGKEPPPWPDAEKVEEARREEITTKVGSLAADDIRPFAKTLNLDERLALSEWIESFDDETPAPAGLLALRDTVVDLKPYNPTMAHDPALLEKLGIAPGFKLDPEALRKLAERLALEAKDFSGTAVSLYQAPINLGLLASASRKSDKAEIAEVANDYYLQRQAQWFQRFKDAEVLAMIAFEGQADFWTVKDGKVQPLSSEDSEDAEGSAIRALKELRESKSMSVGYIVISVLTRADAERLTADDEEEEE